MKDKQIEKLLKLEKERQGKFINLIASENFVSQDVLDALGSETTNKYAEGYPGARYYGGAEIVDQIENLCIERAKKLFKLSSKWHVNVQALSGSPANLAVFTALVPQGGKIMAMTLSSGGHLTHAQSVSLTGKIWKQVPFEVDPKTELLDYDTLEKQAQKEKPNLIVAGFTAYPKAIDWKRFRKIADSCGALLMVDMSHIAGLVAGGAYNSPFACAHVVTTTTHKTLRGPRGAMIFSRTDVDDIHKKIDKAVFPGIQGGPHMNAIASIAVALKEASEPKFKTYAKQVVKNAQALAKELSDLGWRIVAGGTDSHMILVDTWMNGVGISGKEASQKLEKEGIIVNMNTIPHDTRKPFDPSGIRIGTPAVTTQGMKEKDMIKLAKRIDSILKK